MYLINLVMISVNKNRNFEEFFFPKFYFNNNYKNMLIMDFIYLRPLYHTALCETLYYILKVFYREKNISRT